MGGDCRLLPGGASRRAHLGLGNHRDTQRAGYRRCGSRSPAPLRDRQDRRRAPVPWRAVAGRRPNPLVHPKPDGLGARGPRTRRTVSRDSAREHAGPGTARWRRVPGRDGGRGCRAGLADSGGGERRTRVVQVRWIVTPSN